MFKSIKDFIQNLSFVGGEWRTDGIHKKTRTKYDTWGFDIRGWSVHKFNKKTYSKYDIYGWDYDGWSEDKINKKTEKKYDVNGYNYFGFNKNGYDVNGFDKNGFDKNGFDKNGFDNKGGYYIQSEAYYDSILTSNNGILIALLAKIAKSDGFISPNEAIYIGQIIDDMHVDTNFREVYGNKIVNREKDITSNIEYLCKSLPITALRDITIFLQKLVKITTVDGVFYEAHYTMMLEIMKHLHIDEKTQKTFIAQLLQKKPSVNKDIEVVQDKELEKLKKELKKLENKLQELIEKKVECLNDIEEFNQQYNLQLGELIKSILNLKKEILHHKTIKKRTCKDQYQEDFKTLEDTKDTINELKETLSQLEEQLDELDEDDENYNELLEAHEELQKALDGLEKDLISQEEELQKIKSFMENDELDEEYEEVKSQYEEYTNDYEQIQEAHKDIFTLNENEKVELKKLYKKAARLCHPDIVPDELKEKAHKLMQELNHAYSKKDLKNVQKILASLESGSGFELTSDSIADKELLKEKIKEYKNNIAQTESEIETIKEDDTYQTILELDDWDAYFEALKSELQKEIQRLKEEAKSVLEESNEEDLSEEDDSSDNTLDTDEDDSNGIKMEESAYAAHIQSMQNPSFEKIRRYCNNLVDENHADEMQAYLAEDGKMHKALIYDALEQFLERVDGQTILLIDWGCGQGIGSMLVLDYIREKQLNIKIDKVMLLDNDAEYLSRAILHVEGLKQNDIDIIAIDVRNAKDIEKLNKLRNHLSLNLFVNDVMPLEYLDIDFDIFENAYFMCISNESDEKIEEFFEIISDFAEIDKIISNRETKVGKFKKFEKIFRLGEI
ncbi:MAG: hypothetical protein EOM50_09935 [Erysipelotrichia bacterium]|nr:hypothetical protein [Erysipelotrichia bacterium]